MRVELNALPLRRVGHAARAREPAPGVFDYYMYFLASLEVLFLLCSRGAAVRLREEGFGPTRGVLDEEREHVGRTVL